VVQIGLRLLAIVAIAAELGAFQHFSLLQRISAASLRGHVSFLASDPLQGRDTPSPGLDIASEYIGAQFRAAGLKPAGEDGSYFQTAELLLRAQPTEGLELEIKAGQEQLSIGREQISIRSPRGLDIDDVPALKVDSPEVTAEQVSGKVLLLEAGKVRLAPLRRLNPALIVAVLRGPREPPGGSHSLVDPESSSQKLTPALIVSDDRLAKLFDEINPGATEVKISARIPEPQEKPVKARNVIGVLRGSDPALQDTYVLLTAHYDHIGTRAAGEDRIYNGANDNASGAAAVMEIAAALSEAKIRPRRSIAFMAFFGEETGLVGSRYYVRHPAFPLSKTVAHLNLEQLGRSDDSQAPQVAKATVTGFSLSTLPAIFARAGVQTGITVYNRETQTENYFARSDNLPLAEAGVPAHTLAVTLDFPDYHGVDDEWEKLDYENMVKVTRMTALGLLTLTNSLQAPQWNKQNPQAAPYLKAAQALKN